VPPKFAPVQLEHAALAEVCNETKADRHPVVHSDCKFVAFHPTQSVCLTSSWTSLLQAKEVLKVARQFTGVSVGKKAACMPLKRVAAPWTDVTRPAMPASASSLNFLMAVRFLR